MGETIKQRLDGLANETHGELSHGTTAIVGGWTVKTMPSGEKIATVELDYVESEGFSWDEQSIAYLQESIPNSIFTTVNNCEVKVTDISIGSSYKNSMIVATKELFGVGATDKIGVIPLEVAFGNYLYTAPSKLHAIWTVRGY